MSKRAEELADRAMRWRLPMRDAFLEIMREYGQEVREAAAMQLTQERMKYRLHYQTKIRDMPLP